MALITFQSKPINTCGELPLVGTSAPDFLLANHALDDISLAHYEGKCKVLSIVPSLDTPICASSARKFNQKASNFKNSVILLISADLPFAQCRFCESEGLNNIIALSTFRSHFAQTYGVLIMDSLLCGLTARAILIIDEHNNIRYTQLVPELTHEPDYDAVFTALKHL